MTDKDTLFDQCADLLSGADGLLITAGAGMGVDSGLPDFRGNDGFWKVYPALADASMRFEAIASPAAFETQPRRAWGFYGHRLDLYRRTVPHEGFRILRDIAALMPHGAFVFTSNVDGQFQKAGFAGAQVAECHGSIHHLQCLRQCSVEVWSAADFRPSVDEARCELLSALPLCPKCNGIARPNILMFNDWGWLSSQWDSQERRLMTWLSEVERLVVIEIGAGTHIPTVRHFSQGAGGPLIRINPTEPDLGSARGVSLQMGGLAALRGIRDAM